MNILKLVANRLEKIHQQNHADISVADNLEKLSMICSTKDTSNMTHFLNLSGEKTFEKQRQYLSLIIHLFSNTTLLTLQTSSIMEDTATLNESRKMMEHGNPFEQFVAVLCMRSITLAMTKMKDTSTLGVPNATFKEAITSYENKMQNPPFKNLSFFDQPNPTDIMAATLLTLIAFVVFKRRLPFVESFKRTGAFVAFSLYTLCFKPPPNVPSNFNEQYSHVSNDFYVRQYKKMIDARVMSDDIVVIASCCLVKHWIVLLPFILFNNGKVDISSLVSKK